MARILIMEDDAEMAFSLSESLGAAGHETEWCRNGASALERLEEGIFDLLITDIFVYEGGKIISDGGISLIGKVRLAEMQRRPQPAERMPVIAITVATRLPGTGQVLDWAVQIGADYGLEKPFEEVELLELVESALVDVGAASLPS